MAGLWRRIVCVASAFTALALAGCNMVVSETPLFTVADAAPTPPLRDGVWGGGVKDGCTFDPAAPVEAWPDCADWFLVRGDTISSFDEETGTWEHAALRGGRLSVYKDGRWTEEGGFLLVGGDPLVGQLGAAKQGEPRPYFYIGLRPRFDEAGRVVELSAWPVLCGPPPPPAQPGEPPALVTREPFPGLTMVENNCTTTSKEVLRAAARASEGLEPQAPSARWLRDGDR